MIGYSCSLSSLMFLMSAGSTDAQETGWREKDDRTIKEIRSYLEREDLDVFIPWKMHHIAYLTNYHDAAHQSIMWDEMCVVLAIPRENDAFMVGGAHIHWAGMPEYGIAPWWLVERHKDEPVLENAVKVMKEKGLDKARIGIEKRWMPVAIYDYLCSALPDAEFVSADSLIPQIRLIKTEREQMLLKKAAEIGMRAMEAYMQAIRSGATRHAAEHIRAQRAIDYGGEWVGGAHRPAWTGGVDNTPAWWDAPARQRFLDNSSLRNWKRLPDDAPFFVTHFEAKFQYYWCDIAWHEFYGDEPADDDLIAFGDRQIPYRELRHDFEVITRIQRESLHQIKPGMGHIEARDAVNSYLKSDPEATEHRANYFIHGVGLEVHEEPVLQPPVLMPRDWQIYFHPGAVVSSEWFTLFWTVEDPFVMTETGWEPLTDLKGLIGP